MSVNVMDKSKENKKVNRKQNRCKNILMKHENLETVDTPTKYVFVGNGGLACGVQRDMVLKAFSKYGTVEDVVMVLDKPYCFIIYEEEAMSLAAMSNLNGKKLQKDFDSSLYLGFVKEVPKVTLPPNNLPPGAILLQNFVTEEDEEELLQLINFTSDEKSMKHRNVKHFGYKFNYHNNNVDRDKPLEEKIPQLCDRHFQKLVALGHLKDIPDQLTVNQYKPGQGIPPHVDTHSAFEDEIVSLSLGSSVVMDFEHPNGNSVSVFLPQRSVLIMKGESRYLWRHGITPRKTDVIILNSGHLDLQYRETRTSFTFRRVRHNPCNCDYKKQCDSQNPLVSRLTNENDITESKAKGIENDYVAQVYENIAEHFSTTRYKPWPLVAKFMDSIAIGSVVIDAGCGNGKNMSNCKDFYQVGCDISLNLAELCAKQELQVVVGNVLCLPFRDNCADMCICIAVIHHMATKARRIQALKEICRVMRVGGKALLYVWALEQETSKGASNYLSDSKIRQKSDSNVLTTSHDVSLPIHENRTPFEQQDLFVPWQTKNEPNDETKIYHRYYHVFKNGELSSLVSEIDNVEILDVYYDSGNWGLIFQKIK